MSLRRGQASLARCGAVSGGHPTLFAEFPIGNWFDLSMSDCNKLHIDLLAISHQPIWISPQSAFGTLGHESHATANQPCMPADAGFGGPGGYLPGAMIIGIQRANFDKP